MSNWNVKDFLEPVPQPAKTWVARTFFFPFFIVGVPIVAVIDGAKWGKEMYGEIIDAWRDVRAW